jgi:hypothetical protein
MFEAIFHLRKGELLGKKLFVLEGSKQAIELLLGVGDNSAHETEWELSPDDR